LLCHPGGDFLDSVLGNQPNDPHSTPLTLTFTNPVAAIGWDELNYNPGVTLSVTVNFLDGGSAQESGALSNIPGPGSSLATTFFGYQSSVADITSVVIDTNNTKPFAEEFAVDNVAFGGQPGMPAPAGNPSPGPGTTAAPEPAQFFPVLGGLAFLWHRLRRRR